MSRPGLKSYAGAPVAVVRRPRIVISSVLAAWLVGAAGCPLPSRVTPCDDDRQCPVHFECDPIARYCVPGADDSGQVLPWSVDFVAPAQPMHAARSWYLFVWDTSRSDGTPLRPDTTFRVERFATADCGGTALTDEHQPLRYTLFAGMQPGRAYSIRVTAYDAAGTPSRAACSPTVTSAEKLALGQFYSCTLRSADTLQCWGRGDSGQTGAGIGGNLGDNPGELGDALQPVVLGTDFLPIDVVAGAAHTCSLSTSGALKCWGANGYGQLGLGDASGRGDAAAEMGDRLPAIDVWSGRILSMVSAGINHTCGLVDNAAVKCWGKNEQGQLGLGDTLDRGDGPDEMGSELRVPDLGTGRSAVVVAAFGAHSCAILDDLSLKCWGANANGQLGQGDISNRGDAANEMGDALPGVDLGAGRVLAVTGGSNHTCALLDGGAVKCWGSNGSGQLGYGGTDSLGDSPGEMGEALPAVDLGADRIAIAIAANANHSCALLDDATVKCWGENGYGQLGQGDRHNRGNHTNEMGQDLLAVDLGTNSRAVAVAAGSYHSCAAIADGSLKCWGNNNRGELGHKANLIGDETVETGDALAAVDLGTSAQGVALHSGWGEGFCATFVDQQTRCWGHINGGLYGDEPDEMGSRLPALELGSTTAPSAIGIGAWHSCAILDTGSVKCWGGNASGQLGLGDTDSRNRLELLSNQQPVDLGVELTATHIAVGADFTCARLSNKQIKCWGDNSLGQLGRGDTNDAGGAAGQMGEALPAVDLGSDTFASAVVVGRAHACGLLEGGRVKCWGYNRSGQLGIGDDVNRGDAPGEMGDLLPEVDLGGSRLAIALAAGYDHTCALLDDNSVKCWGGNYAGSLGAGDSAARGRAAGEMGDALPAVDLGSNASVIALACGVYHCCALLETRDLKCWGANDVGELGVGDHEHRGDETGEMGNALPIVALAAADVVVAIALSHRATCAMVDNSSVRRIRCWGENTYGELGTGELNSWGDNSGEMGDALPFAELGQL